MLVLFVVYALFISFEIVYSIKNYCPNNDTNQWINWQCRRHTMIFKGELHDFNQINFNQLHETNKTTLRIHLTNREQSIIPSDIFRAVPKLKHLDINFNATHIPANIFDTLTELEHLSVYTYQDTLPKDIFRYLSNLKYLKLVMRYNGLRLKPHERECQYLEVTKPHERQTHSLLDAKLFSSLNKLEKLYITCDCTKIPVNILNSLTNLKVLFIKTNVTKYINGFLDNQINLETLNINSMAKTTIFEDRLFQNLYDLQTLTIKANKLFMGPHLFHFKGQNKLQMLTISSHLPKIHKNQFHLLNNLMWLDLGSTGLKHLPDHLLDGCCQNLKDLRIENNNIKSIPKHFFDKCGNLTSLVLRKNDISVVHSNTFSKLQSLVDIHIQNNPKWHMTCDYGFSDEELFPELKYLTMYEMSHQCIHPWMLEIQNKRPNLKMEHSSDKTQLPNCELIEIPELPDKHEPFKALQIQFTGPSLFIHHKAYWVSNSVDPCSDFANPSKFSSSIHHTNIIPIHIEGHGTFTFKTPGQYNLVYQYGKDSPFIYYNKYSILIA